MVTAHATEKTLTCVAIPAWSQPGTHRVVLPVIRCLRTTASSIALVNACPMCRTPVTLGGGMMIVKLPLGSEEYEGV